MIINGNMDVGPYKGQTVPMRGEEMSKNLVYGRGLWALLFVVGTCVQCNSGPAKAREVAAPFPPRRNNNNNNIFCPSPVRRASAAPRPRGGNSTNFWKEKKKRHHHHRHHHHHHRQGAANRPRF
jgi:hypothetical protein